MEDNKKDAPQKKTWYEKEEEENEKIWRQNHSVYIGDGMGIHAIEEKGEVQLELIFDEEYFPQPTTDNILSCYNLKQIDAMEDNWDKVGVYQDMLQYLHLKIQILVSKIEDKNQKN
jgi:hypothetical protein